MPNNPLDKNPWDGVYGWYVCSWDGSFRLEMISLLFENKFNIYSLKNKEQNATSPETHQRRNQKINHGTQCPQAHLRRGILQQTKKTDIVCFG